MVRDTRDENAGRRRRRRRRRKKLRGRRKGVEGKVAGERDFDFGSSWWRAVGGRRSESVGSGNVLSQARVGGSEEGGESGVLLLVELGHIE